MLQQKHPKYSLGERPSLKPAGRKIAKNKELKSTIIKNLSELPISLPNKENCSHINSLIAHTRHARVESAMGTYEGNKKRVSMDSSTNKKPSLAKHSLKKAGKNNKSTEEEWRFRLADERKKCNLSCSSMIDDQTNKKKSLKAKRPSLKNRENGRDLKNVFVKELKGKEKSKLKIKPTNIESKSINVAHEKSAIKKKQSTSTTVLAAKKPKKPKQKKQAPIQEENSLEEYPTNKYNVDKPLPHRPLKHRKFSTSKDRSKRASSLCEVDYSSCINILSRSSGIMGSSGVSKREVDKLDAFQVKQNSILNLKQLQNSVNLQQIRYYESVSPQRGTAAVHKFKQAEKKLIEMEINEQYPNFTESEQKFLAGVILIQRKWRQYTLYKKIFDKKFLSTKAQNTCSQSQHLKICDARDGIYLRQTRFESYPTEKTPIISIEQKNSLDSPCIEKPLQLQNKAYLDESKDSQEPVQSEQKQLSLSHQNSPPFLVRAEKIHYEFLEQEIFPNITYLLIKKEQLREKLQVKIQSLAIKLRRQEITEAKYQSTLATLEQEYKKAIQYISKSRKDIKKGYLKFIDSFRCIRSLKNEGLRRVSSETGFMSLMYKKIYKLDHTMEEHSDSSESLKRLTKNILIRKQFYHTQKIDKNYFGHELFASSERTHKKSQQKLSNREIESQAKCFRSQKNKIFDAEKIRQKGEQKPFSEKSERSHFSKNADVESPPCSEESSVGYIIAEDELARISFQKEKMILESLIIELTQQFYLQLINLDEKRQKAIQVDLGREKKKATFFEEDKLEISSSLMTLIEDEEGEGLAKYREIYSLDIPNQSQQFKGYSRKHRESHTHTISPLSSDREKEESFVEYAAKLIAYIKDQKLIDGMVLRINQNQGFTAREYLKFLRDFQIPEDQYQPLFSNQFFLKWEEFYLQNHSDILGKSEKVHQLSTIYHRCIFESFLIELEHYRPCGEKGLPFPWEAEVIFVRPITAQRIQQIFQLIVSKFREIESLKCGIIDEKHIICSEDDFQRLHEENEDRIISMLEKEYCESAHDWYQIEEHALELKMEVENEIYDYLMLEIIDELFT